MKRLICSAKAGAWVEIGEIKCLCSGFLFLFLLGTSLAYSGPYKVNERTRVYTIEASPDSLIIKFDNDFTVPVTVRLNLNLENLTGEPGPQISAVVPAKSTGHILAQYRKKIATLPYNCAYSWKIVLGDALRFQESNYVYSYPFQKGNNYKIAQGPHGSFSHQDMFAYDFLMPLGSPVTAARDGIVALIKMDSSVGGPDNKFREDANFISIYHADGTIANYLHLNTDGAVVKEGQVVRKGALIGYSGNTGFSTGPHLHFEVIRPNLDADKNQSISFNWEDGANSLITYLPKKSFIYNIFFGKHARVGGEGSH